jgi:hypothetical protein
MTRDDILSAVQAVYFGDTDNTVITQLLDKLEDALPHSEISDLIFHDFRGLMPEQVVDEAMRREAEHASKHAKKSSEN